MGKMYWGSGSAVGKIMSHPGRMVCMAALSGVHCIATFSAVDPGSLNGWGCTFKRLYVLVSYIRAPSPLRRGEEGGGGLKALLF